MQERTTTTGEAKGSGEESVEDTRSEILDLVLKLWVAIVIAEGLGALPSDFSRSNGGGQPMQAGLVAIGGWLVGLVGSLVASSVLVVRLRDRRAAFECLGLSLLGSGLLFLETRLLMAWLE